MGSRWRVRLNSFGLCFLSFCDVVDRLSLRLRLRWRHHPRERSERYSRRIDRDVQRAARDLQQDSDDVDHALQRHPRLAAMVAQVGAVMREQSAEQVGLAASGAAFWLVISAIPTAIAVVSVFGLVVSPERVATDLGTLAHHAPSSLGGLLTAQLRQVTVSNHTGISFGLAVSVVLAVWSASAGVYNLDRAIRVAYGLPPQNYVEAAAVLWSALLRWLSCSASPQSAPPSPGRGHPPS